MILLELALLTYPEDVRTADRDVLLGLAGDMIEGGSSERREATSLAADGLRTRFGRRRIGNAPWGDALRLVGVPLATLFLALTVVGALGSVSGLVWIGWYWTFAIGGALAAVIGQVAGWRRVAVVGALLIVGACLLGLRNQPRMTARVWVNHAGGSVTGSVEFATLGAMSIGALILVASALATERGRRPRSGAWSIAAASSLVVAAGALGSELWPFRSIDDGPGLRLTPSAIVLALAVIAAVVAVAARRDLPGRLAATLGLIAVAPPAVLALQSWGPANQTIWRLALPAAALVGVRALVLSAASDRASEADRASG